MAREGPGEGRDLNGSEQRICGRRGRRPLPCFTPTTRVHRDLTFPLAHLTCHLPCSSLLPPFSCVPLPGVLCYLNHKNFWRLIMDSSSSIINSPGNSASQGSLKSTVWPSNSQEDIPNPDKQKDKQQPLGLSKSFSGPYPATLG